MIEKYKDKINYIIVESNPNDIYQIEEGDTEDRKNQKYILNALKRENYQRNSIKLGLQESENEDYIMVSDIDEIPNLEKNNLKNINKKLIFFKQKIFNYKFNLHLESFIWYGTKVSRKKNLISPQWLRNVKGKKYPFWRIETIISKKKYQNIHIIEDGGWHFSYIKEPKDIEKKLKSYLHHREYDVEPAGINKIEQLIKDKKTIYDLRVDMRKSKFTGGQDLKIVDTGELPSYLQKNIEKYKQWLA